MYIDCSMLLCLALLLLLEKSLTSSVCPNLDDRSVQHFDARLPADLEIPERRTFYVCQQVAIPTTLWNEKKQIIAFQALISNKEVMHHMIVFGCQDGTAASKPHECGPLEDRCRSFLTVWSLGFEDKICMHNNTGIRIGQGGYKTLSLQIHWNNEALQSHLLDSSGMRVYFTDAIRKYEVGNVQIGQNDLDIPPRTVHFSVSGGCTSYCSKKILKEAVYFTRTFIHMHDLGTAGRMDHYRNGTYLATIAFDGTYSYKRPPVHQHEPAVQILPGDEVILTCWFTSSGDEKERNVTTYWGEGTDGEMCYAFVTYFPKAHGFDQCVQYDKFDQCDNYNQNILLMGSCDFQSFGEEMGGDLGQIRSHCNESQLIGCKSQCAQSVKRVFKHPCMQGRLAVFLERRVMTTVNWSKVHRLYNALINSCQYFMR